MNPTVLVLGAARQQIFTLKAIKELGCRLVAIDRNPLAPGAMIADVFKTVDVRDIEGALQVAKEHGVDAILPLNDFGVITASAVAEALGLVGISRKAAADATNKARMRAIWAETNVPSARFQTVQTLDEAYYAVEELGVWPLIFKPADSRGGGSRGVSRVTDMADVPRALAFAHRYSMDKVVVIEEYLEGTEHSVEMVVAGGNISILAVSDKQKTSPPYRVDKSVIYPTRLGGDELVAVHDVAVKATQALGITVGAAHVELCMTNEGPKLFEIGARFGGGHIAEPIIRYVTGINFVHEVVRVLLGQQPGKLVPINPIRGCVYRFLMPPAGILRSVSGIDDISRWRGILDCGLWVQVGERIRPVRTGSDRAGFIVAAGDNREFAMTLADSAEMHVRFDVVEDHTD